MTDRLVLTREAVRSVHSAIEEELKSLEQTQQAITTLNNIANFTSHERLEEALVDCRPMVIPYREKVIQLKAYVKLRDNEQGEISDLYDGLITHHQELMRRQREVEESYEAAKKRVAEKK